MGVCIIFFFDEIVEVFTEVQECLAACGAEEFDEDQVFFLRLFNNCVSDAFVI